MYISQSMCVSTAGDLHTCQQDKVNFNLCIPQKQNTAILLKQDLAIHIQQSLQRLLHWFCMPPKWVRHSDYSHTSLSIEHSPVTTVTAPLVSKSGPLQWSWLSLSMPIIPSLRTYIFCAWACVITLYWHMQDAMAQTFMQYMSFKQVA